MKSLHVLRTFHAWCGAALALLVIVCSLSGTLLVWKQNYVRLTTPAARIDYEPSPESLATIAAAVEARYDNNLVLVIEFPTRDFPLTKVRLDETRYAYLDTDGELVAEWVQNERWEEWLYDLHHRLLLDATGLTIVGIAALMLVFVVLAGLILFWPLRRGFRQGLWPKGSSRPRLLVSHRNIGVVVALPFLLTLVTAALQAFPDQAVELLLEPFRDENYSLDFSEKLDAITGPQTAAWLPAMQRALASFPGAAIRTAQVPNDYSSYRIIGLQQAGDLHPIGLSKVYIDADGGWMDIRIDMANQHMSERLYNTAYPLHTGRFGNLAYKLFLSVSGLLVTALAVLGLICFVRKSSLRG